MPENRELKLHVVLRTCDRVAAVHGGAPRICGNVSKREIIQRCVRSLVRSMKRLWYVGSKLTVVDDHSSPELLEWLRKEIPQGSQIVPVPDPGGNGRSMATAYEVGALMDSDVVYFVEDDYLHGPDSIGEMSHAIVEFRRNFGNEVEVAVAPTDDKWDYKPDDIRPCRVVNGVRRHWRTNDHTCFTMMISRSAIIHYWKLLEAFTHYGEPGVSEDNTINLMYRGGGVVLFTPMPGVAVHLNGDEVFLLDWIPWWYPNIKRLSMDAFSQMYPTEPSTTPPKMKWQESDELQILRSLIQHFKVESVLEIGVNRGDTAGYLLSECPSIKRYLGVDRTSEDTSMLTSVQQREIAALQPDAGMNAKSDPRFELLLHREGSKGIPLDRKFDFVLIDGDHSEEWAAYDTELAKKLVTGPAIIAWHDYCSELGVSHAAGRSGLPVWALEYQRMAISVGVLHE